MNAGHLKEVALMVDRMDFARIAENAPLAIAQNSPLFPTALQQFVHHLQILVGVVVARIVVGLALLADIARAAFQIRSDDIPADPPLVRWSRVESRRAKG